MIDISAQRLSAVVDRAVSGLVKSEHFASASIVSLPLTYPSGASVQIEVTAQANRCFITDSGGAHQEAELMGALRYFSRESEGIATEAGIKFDGRDFFAAEVPIQAIAGGIITVANCSQLAASLAAIKSTERVQTDVADELYRRLRALLPSKDVAKEAEIMGASSHKWKIAVLVSDHKLPAAFDVVSTHYNSVVSTAAKFHDLARLEHAPVRISVVHNRLALGKSNFLGVLSAASSSVVEANSADDVLMKSMAA